MNATQPAGSASSANEDQKRILVVDDDRDFAEGLGDLLELSGYVVQTVHNAAAAESVCREFQPAVACLDVNLGGISGLDLIADLQEQDSDLVCIMVTASAEVDVAIEAIKKGAYDYLRKPLDEGEVFVVLDRCFEKLNLERAKLAADEVAQRANTQLLDALESIPDGFILYDGDGRFVICNGKHRELYPEYADYLVPGASRADLLRIYAEKSAPSVQQSLSDDWLAERLEQAGEPRPVMDRELADGRWIRISERKTGQGGIVGIRTDITDLKKREAALRESDEKLRQAQKMEAVGQLTGGIAHDFNNLLTIVLGNLEFVQEELDDNAGMRKFLDIAVSAVERGADLTHRLLAFSRKQTLAPTVLDVNKLVPGMTELMRRVLGENIEIEIVLAGDLWPAMVDAGQLENALLNLAINARDAMPEGGRLTIETANVQLDGEYAAAHGEITPGPYVMVALSDTGHGMTPEVREKVFEPFFTTKEAGRGSGLGLSMIYGFVKQSGGHISLYSEPSHGTIIKLYLPRASADEQDRAETRIARVEPPTGCESILVVEDDQDVRDFAAKVLADLGYRVLEARDGHAAIALLDETPDIDLLFTDVVMPGGMNGRQTADEALKRRPGMKVLFTSGYTGSAIVHHGRLDAGLELLPKPYSRANLAAKVRDILDRRES